MIEIPAHPLSEEEVCTLEGLIPEWAASATHAAYLKALASALPVTIKRDGHLVEVLGDGTFQIVGEAKPTVRVKTGEVFKIRSRTGSA